jgi:HlyD family secretion protein
MPSYFSKESALKVKSYVIAHKVLSAFLILIVLGTAYWGAKRTSGASGPTQYVLSAVTRETIIQSITATGQVSANDRVDLKPQGSSQSAATIREVDVRQGDSVHAGQLIAVVNNPGAGISLQQAQASVQSAQASYDKVVNGATSQTLASALASLQSAQTSLRNAQDSLRNKIGTIYNDALSAVLINTNPLFSNPSSIQPLYSVSGSYSSNSQLVTTIQNERVTLNDLLPKWQAEVSAMNSSTDLSAAVTTTNSHLQTVTQFLNDILSDLTSYEVTPSAATSYISSINSARGTMTGDITSLLSAKQSVDSAAASLASAQASYNSTAAPARPEDMATAAASLANAKASLQNAQYNYDQNFIRAPFDGVVAQVNVSSGDQANTSTIVATLVTTKQLAAISLNEVDASKVQLGQKVTVTFDALPDLTITGHIAQIDTVGTVTQGVVTYNAQIAFDTQDARIKPGMSVSASIITAVKPDVLAVPNAAVKFQSGSPYVETLDPATTASSTAATTTGGGAGQTVTSSMAPQRIPVVVGISDDSMTEIISGLTEGQMIISRTIASSAAKATASAPSLFGAVGGNRAATGGAVRAGGR